MLGICALCVYVTIRRKALEEEYMYCAVLGDPVVQGTSHQSIIYQLTVVNPSGISGTCIVAEPCTDASCQSTQQAPPIKMRCWDESLDSSIPVCDSPESFWRTYMYTSAGFGLAGALFVFIALYASGCCTSRDDDYSFENRDVKKRKGSLIPLSARV